jgi:cellulose synthase/poly-beta-1,6-N-acetylglucosamine synthase-like glycosyltransferase
LRSFVELEFARSEWELIVVNDGGPGSFARIDDELKARLPLTLTEIPNAGPATARNHGATLATGEILAFTDDDCRVHPQWLRAFAEMFEDRQWSGAGGRTQELHPGSAASRANHCHLGFLTEYMRDDSGNMLLLPSNNVAYRRAVFERFGGFDTSFPLAAGEDFEICLRMVASGLRLGLQAEAMIWHDHATSARGYFKQHFRHGRGAGRIRRAMERLDGGRPKKAREKRYFRDLARYLRRAQASPAVWVLAFASPFVYHLGDLYEEWVVSRSAAK